MKVYCQKGHPNEILACFCNRCGEPLSKKSVANTSTPAPKARAEEIDEEYAAFLEFSRARKKKRPQPEYEDDDDDGDEDTVPLVSQLRVQAKSDGPGKITLGNVMNTAQPGEGDFQRPRNQVDVNTFMEQRAKWISSRNEIEV